ncbi:MAG: SpoIIE family protein phosphatase [Roseburia sp.]|nr:SpoIIE family protein phosphatase [Roseburia sp.]
MKKNVVRQMILSAVSGLLCGVHIMDCYPFVPAYFAALYLAEVKVGWILAATYIGMMFFMPFTAMVKYAVILTLVIGIVKLVEWATDGRPASLVGLLTALVTMIVSFCGSLLEWRNQPVWQAVLLEGMFVLGAIILLHRAIHTVLEWHWEPPVAELPETKNEERLRGYAESFEGLSKVFLHMSERKDSYSQEEYGRLQNELTGKLCLNCDACAICWEKETAPIYEILPRLISEIMEKGRASKEQQDELGQYCKRSKDMVAEAVRVFERVSLNRAWYNRLLENRQTIAEQLDAMAYIMQDCAKEEVLLDTKEKGKLMDLRYHAKESGIIIEQLHLYESVDGHLKLLVRMKSKAGCISIKTFLNLANRVLGRKMRGQAEAKTFVAKEAVDFIFVEDTKFRSVQGIERRKKDGAYVSGDNFSILELENGNFLMGLSDGMGSGSTACKESELVLDLVEKFLEAGFSMETAIRMMNSAMVLKGEEDLFSTVDLCNIDLYNGKASFFKIGAAASFLKHEGEVRCFSSHSLPVGVANNPEIECEEMTLKNGDFVVMVTDGVLEYLHVPRPEETMCEIIESIDCRHPGVLVKKIMERVLLFTGGRVQDDMTILATCVWEK